VGYTILDIFAFVTISVKSDWVSIAFPLQYVGAIIMAVGYLRFSYLFKEEMFPSEQERVHKIALFTGVIGLIYLIAQFIITSFGDYLYIQILLPIPILLILWSTLVFGRKWWRSRKYDQKKSNYRSAYLSFFVLSLLANILSIVPALKALELIHPVVYTISFFVLNLSIFCGIYILFINHVTEKTTVLVKLVGISLVLFTTVIGLQGFLISFDSYSEIITDNSSLDTLRAIHVDILPFAWFLLGSVGVILITFPVFFSKSVLSPLRELLVAVDKVNSGKLDAEIAVANNDEIGIVSGHFNEMTKSLKKAHTDLQIYANELEQRVDERTLELNQQNELLERINLQLQQKKEALESMSESRSHLFVNISHELRTPITLISGPINQLLSNKELPDHLKKQLRLSLRNADRLKQLVEQILDLNRLESNRLVLRASSIDVCKAVSIITSSFYSLFEHNGITFHRTIPEKSIELYLDGDKFEKVMNNLISNAIKFTPNGGTISAKIEETESAVIISLSDSGIGISVERLPHIFERFNTSADSKSDYREGLGVGLTLSKEYVELHGGEVSVSSKIGEGSCFEIRFKKGKDHLLPQQILESSTLIQTRVPSQKSSLLEDQDDTSLSDTQHQVDQPNLLLVEDNQDMATYISELLKEQGYIVTLANNGKEALECLSRVRPDLIISDIMMPIMDGFEFLSKLRETESFNFTPTIFLSARNDLEGRLEGLRLGVNDYLVKPFHPDELIVRIDNLLELHQSRKQTAIELSEESDPSLDQKMVAKLTDLIEAQIQDIHLTVEHLAGSMAMSRRTLYREIKRTTGFTAASFIREVRLQKARQKIETGAIRSISELALEIGFQSSSYFSKVFEKRFGQKPQTYLKD
jgi:signal transduction histidine kinase/DNA-binding response OmpR family regulator